MARDPPPPQHHHHHPPSHLFSTFVSNKCFAFLAAICVKMQSLTDALPSFSSFAALSSDKSAWLVQGALAAAYALFYTAYDKSTKKLSMSLLLDFLLIRPGPAKNRGLTWALNEWNKLISLVAITR